MRDQPEFTVKARKMGIIKKIYPGVCVGIVDSKHKYKQSCDNNDNVIDNKHYIKYLIFELIITFDVMIMMMMVVIQYFLFYKNYYNYIFLI